MEHDLSKVWTKDLIPYPGMGGIRGEHLFRASANSVMRKLSRASVASGFTKRSASFASLTNSRFGEYREGLKDYNSSEDNDDGENKTYKASFMNHVRVLDRIDSIGYATTRCAIPPERSSSRNGTNSKGSCSGNQDWEAEAPPGIDADSKDATGNTHGRSRTLRNRWSSPISLIRTISKEKLKNMLAPGS